MAEETKTKLKMNPMLMTVIVALIVGAAAFYGGMRYQQSRRGMFAGQFGQNAGNFRGQNGQSGNRGGNGGFAPVMGDIISSDDKSITVKLQDGSSKIVILSDSTTVNKAEQGSKTDLTSGTKVLVFGQTNSDGSVTAQSVQLNPPDRGMRQGM